MNVGRRSLLRTVPAGLALTALSCLGVGDALQGGRRLPGGYWLTEFEGTDYYITRDGVQTALGVLNGRVTHLGWSDTLILAWREGNRDPSGWMVIDVHDHRIDGPYSSKVLDQMRKDSPSLSAIGVHTARDAWGLLK